MVNIFAFIKAIPEIVLLLKTLHDFINEFWLAHEKAQATKSLAEAVAHATKNKDSTVLEAFIRDATTRMPNQPTVPKAD